VLTSFLFSFRGYEYAPIRKTASERRWSQLYRSTFNPFNLPWRQLKQLENSIGHKNLVTITEIHRTRREKLLLEFSGLKPPQDVVKIAALTSDDIVKKPLYLRKKLDELEEQIFTWIESAPDYSFSEPTYKPEAVGLNPVTYPGIEYEDPLPLSLRYNTVDFRKQYIMVVLSYISNPKMYKWHYVKENFHNFLDYQLIVGSTKPLMEVIDEINANIHIFEKKEIKEEKSLDDLAKEAKQQARKKTQDEKREKKAASEKTSADEKVDNNENEANEEKDSTNKETKEETVKADKTEDKEKSKKN